jgi:glycosyltransferase involved in cell wall biosynthesis
MILELDLQNDVVFLGYVPGALMPQLYGSARMLVFPSYYEGFGFPIVEAMACGCPVISSNSSSMPEVCGDSALMFDPGSPSELIGRILELLGSDELREHYVKAGLARAVRFSWERAGNQWMGLLDSITKNR